MRGFPGSCAAGALALVCASSAALAQGGPFRVDDSGVEEAGTIKLEASGAFSLDGRREREFSIRPGFTPELLPFVEFSLGLTRSAEGRDPEDAKRRFWGTRLEPEAKVELVPVERHGVGLGLKVGAAWRLSAQRLGADVDPEVAGLRRLESLSAAGIATLRPLESLALNLNLGVERDRIDRRTAPLWGVGAAWRAVEDSPIGGTTLIAEVSGSDRRRSAVQAGLRQTLFEERLDLDLVLGRNLSDERATWLIGGIAVRF
jgi:hypothetical protein